MSVGSADRTWRSLFPLTARSPHPLRRCRRSSGSWPLPCRARQPRTRRPLMASPRHDRDVNPAQPIGRNPPASRVHATEATGYLEAVRRGLGRGRPPASGSHRHKLRVEIAGPGSPGSGPDDWVNRSVGVGDELVDVSCHHPIMVLGHDSAERLELEPAEVALIALPSIQQGAVCWIDLNQGSRAEMNRDGVTMRSHFVG